MIFSGELETVEVYSGALEDVNDSDIPVVTTEETIGDQDHTGNDDNGNNDNNNDNNEGGDGNTENVGG